MKIIKCLAVAVSMVVGSPVWATVVDFFSVSGSGTIEVPSAGVFGTTQISGNGTLDSEGILTFDFTELNVSSYVDPYTVTGTITLNGVFGADGFTPISGTRINTSCFSSTSYCPAGLDVNQTLTYGSIIVESSSSIKTSIPDANNVANTIETLEFTSCNLESSCYPDRIFATPVPASAWLFGSGIVGLATARRRLN